MQPMSYFYFDIPMIHDNTEIGREFINALTERKNMYGSTSV